MTTPTPQPPARPPVPVGRLAATAAIVALPIVEIVLLVLVGTWIGVLPLLLVLLGEAAVGGWLTAREGRKAWRAVQQVAASGRSSGGGELADAALVPLGGLLLIVPGFLTDIVGVMILLPVTRPFARRLVGWFINRQVRQRYGVDTGVLRAKLDERNTIRGETVDGSAPTWTPSRRPGDDGEVISGEIER